MSPSARRRRLIEAIGSFSRTEQTEIHKVLVRHEIPYTSNQNGVFFNFSCVPEPVLDELERCVAFFAENRAALDEFEMRMSEWKTSSSSSASPAPPPPAVPAAAPVASAARRGPSAGAPPGPAASYAAAPRPAVRPRHLGKYTLARKRFTKKTPSDVRQQRFSETSPDGRDILRPEPYAW